jgi:hypothetical protein
VDDNRPLACHSCGHIFDADSGKVIVETATVIVPENQRGMRDCLSCNLLQNVSDEERSKWPDR